MNYANENLSDGEVIDIIAESKNIVEAIENAYNYGYRDGKNGDQMTERGCYTVDELIDTLTELKNESPKKGETIVYIKEVYATDEYLHISDVRLDDEDDIIIEDNIRPQIYW